MVPKPLVVPTLQPAPLVPNHRFAKANRSKIRASTSLEGYHVSVLMIQPAALVAKLYPLELNVADTAAERSNADGEALGSILAINVGRWDGAFDGALDGDLLGTKEGLVEGA